MADPRLIQPWISVKSTATLTQANSMYTNVSGYRDAVVYIEVSDVSAAPLIVFQTAPSADEAAFKLINSTASLTVALGVTRVVLRSASVTVPIARYVRWRLSPSTGVYTATFRVLATLAA